MARVAVLGEQVRVQGFALAGALVLEAGEAAQVRAAWAALAGDVAVVVLTPRAARALQDQPPPAAGLPLTVVLPP
jgi:vacuolar-type H+-ATPase subunit F/Vma7